MKIRKFLALILGLAMLIVGCTTDEPFEPTEPETPQPIEENVTGEVRDENSIEVASSIPGTYTLIYEKGEKQVMVNFSSICILEIGRAHV